MDVDKKERGEDNYNSSEVAKGAVFVESVGMPPDTPVVKGN